MSCVQKKSEVSPSGKPGNASCPSCGSWMFWFLLKRKNNPKNPNQMWCWSQCLLLKDKALSSSNCNFSLELNGGGKTALNSSVAFSAIVWVAVQLEENGDHGGSLSDWKGCWVLQMCPVWFSQGEPDERQKKKKCPYMIPIKNQPFCWLKTFYFEVHQFLDVVWKQQQGHESFQCKNSQLFGI